ncbi:MAG: gliding motility-associated C-terminal domain-containing protein [Taibaiella sp.]|nr:gliding motility-associated C-terminal domain-containing protein [Taibaiella sp.]
MRRFLLLLLLVLGSVVADAQTAECDSIDLADTIHACEGSTVTLNATVYGSNTLISRAWTPAAGLSDPTILNPVLTAWTSGSYKLTLRTLADFNLVVNGDFSAGNTGFSSSYTYAAPPSTTLVEGDYSVYTNPNGVHTGFTVMGDHTTGTGNMMIINAGPTPVDVWCQTIAVSPNTDYDFSAWFANCSSVTVPPNIPTLQFRINGVLQGAATPVTAAPGTWVNFSTIWNSGPSTTATICIYDATTVAAGNDFVIDDIAFKRYCDIADSVYVEVQVPDTTFFSHDTALCSYDFPIGLYSPAGYTNYTWSTGSGSSIGIPATSGGAYWVRSILACDVRMDTFHVTSFPAPAVYLGHDTGFCIGNTYVLSSPQPAGSTWVWSTGSTIDSIHVSASGTYSLSVTNSYGCSDTDEVVILVTTPPVVNLGPDTTVCNGSAFVLSSSVTYTAPSYLWQDYSTTPVLTATATGTYWLQVTEYGCPGADTIRVELKFDTFTLYNPDTAICRGQSVQVRATADADMTFQWRPTTGIANSVLLTPLIKPDTSAMYTVTTHMEGCPDLRDSFYIDVQPVPDPFLGLNRHLCEFDSVHIISSVDPPWYNHYSYHWSPGLAVDDSTITAVVFRAGTSTNIKLTVTTPAGCTGIDSAMMVVHPGNFAVGGGDTTVCPNSSVRLLAAGGVSYKWIPSTYLDDPESATPLSKPETDQNYAVIVTSEYGCRDTLGVKISVSPSAVMNLVDSVVIFPGESYQISPETNGSRFTWTPSGGLSGKFISNPLATPEVSTLYRVQFVTEDGCRAIDSIYINVNENALIAVPNAFTPGAGSNSILYPRKRGLATLKSFRVYNRWGNVVFQSSSFDEGWDGTYKGVPQPLGVYVYTIEAQTDKGRDIVKSGNVTLLR